MYTINVSTFYKKKRPFKRVADPNSAKECECKMIWDSMTSRKFSFYAIHN